MKKIFFVFLLSAGLFAGFTQVQAGWFDSFFSGPYHEVEIIADGDEDKMKISKDSAEVILEKWGGEESLTIKRRGDFGPSVKDFTRGIYSADEKNGSESFLVEPVKEGIKIDIMLYARPETNVFSFDLEGWESFNWFYQPPLTEEKLSSIEMAKLDHCTETDCYDKDGKVFLNRPENIVGSYAVYHKTKKDNQYKTGKAFHIERPLIVDAEGNETWAELKFDNGVLSVITPQEFLDTAMYPVRIDPTFGYTTIGASNQFTNDPGSSKFSAPEDGTITSVTSAYGTFANTVAGHAVYSDVSGVITGLLAQDSGNVAVSGTTKVWYTTDLSFAVTSGTVYWLAHWAGDTGGNVFEAYDAGGTAQYAFDGGNTFETWPNPASPSGYLDRILSIYATYTAEEPPAQGGTNTVIRFFNRIIKFTGGKIIIR